MTPREQELINDAITEFVENIESRIGADINVDKLFDKTQEFIYDAIPNCLYPKK